MNFEKFPSQEGAEQEPKNEKVEARAFRLGEKEYHEGEKVTVVRSDGAVEQDWELKSIGGKFAVVEKIDMNEGGVFRKLVPVNEFADWQSSPQTAEKPYGGLDEGAGGHKGQISERTPEGRAKIAEIRKKMAENFGIDTSKQNWEAEVEKKIREITGV